VGEQVMEASARSGASPAEVFAIVADVTCWPSWGIWTAAVVETPPPDASGVGAVRALTSRTAGRTTVSRERVTELVPGRLLAYELVSGLPLRHYRSRLELIPDGEGTLIRWTSRFDRATYGQTWLYRWVFRRFLADAAQRLARFAEHRHAPA